MKPVRFSCTRHAIKNVSSTSPTRKNALCTPYACLCFVVQRCGYVDTRAPCHLQVSDGGVVTTLVAAIKQYFQDKPVVATACGLLRHLAKSDDIKKMLMKDSLPVFTSILDEHKGKPEVCAEVCPALFLSSAVSLLHYT